MISYEKLQALKAKYPVGTRIRLIAMHKEDYPVPSGTEGSVTGIDDFGMIHVVWDNHSTLALDETVDEFEIKK